MIDKHLVIAILKLLHQMSAFTLSQNVLFNHLAIELTEPASPTEIKEQLRFAEDEGWIEGKRDVFKEMQYSLTPEGKAKLKEIG